MKKQTLSKQTLSKKDNKRGYRVAAFGATLAVGISALVVCLGFYSSTVPFLWEVVLIYCPAAGLATWLCVRYCWRLLIRGGETKKRGAFYGGMSVFLSLLLMSFFVTIGDGLLGVIADGWVSQTIRWKLFFQYLL